jgi:2-polyprenyl-6-methoxyphenol hydroxylase-like FAD-dependent oxidoreductase
MAKAGILIVGAGPTGLAAALELHRLGHAFRIIDRDSGPTPLSKAVGISAHTLDLLEPSGVTPRLLEAGIRIERGYLWHERKRLGTVDFTGLPHRFNFLLSLPQHDTEAIMAEVLAESGVAVEWNTALRSLAVPERSPAAVLDGPAGAEDLGCAHVFGGDGVHSTVRAGAGIAFPGYVHARDWSIADVELTDWFYEPAAAHLLLKDGGDLHFAIPTGTLRYRVISNTPDALAGMDDCFEVSHLVRQDRFRIEVRQAESYRSGAVFLGGDAAHVHSPVGARGMNLGIEDGMAFARHLAGGTLNRYTERRPIGRRWIALSERVLAAAQASSPPLVLLRNVALWTAAHVPWAQRPMLKRVSGLVE